MQSTNILVNHHSGKLSKTGEPKPASAQEGMTCILYGLRRIAFFAESNPKAQRLNAYKQVKHAMKNFHENYDELVKLALNICKDLNIDIEKSLKENPVFMQFYAKRKLQDYSAKEYLTVFSEKFQWSYLYFILVENLVLPLMNIKNSDWHPDDGFVALGESLTTHGAHAFVGRFGSCYHTGQPKFNLFESTAKRNVFYFLKNTYVGDTISFTHCIIVDQVKIVNGRETVFFRDPSIASNSQNSETIFALSYENFVQRLTNFQGSKHTQHQDLNLTYAKVSVCPEKFGHNNNKNTY